MAGEGKDKTPVGNVNLSQRDLAVVAAAWQSLQDDPKIDFERFAKLAGYGSTDSARVCWRGIKKKLLAAGPSSDAADGSATTPKKAITTAKKSSAKKASGNLTLSSAVKDEDEDAMDVDELTAGPQTPSSSGSNMNDTPTKPSTQGKKRGRRAKKTTTATEQATDDDGSLCKKGRLTTIKLEFERREAEEAEAALQADAEGDDEAVNIPIGGPEEV